MADGLLISRAAIEEAVESLRETAYPSWLRDDVSWETLDRTFMGIRSSVPGETLLDQAMGLSAVFGARAARRVYRDALQLIRDREIDGDELHAACRDTGFDPAGGRLARVIARKLRTVENRVVSASSLRLHEPWFAQLRSIETQLGIARACRWKVAGD